MISTTHVLEMADNNTTTRLNKPCTVCESLSSNLFYEDHTTTCTSTENGSSDALNSVEQSAGTPSTNAGDTPSGKDLLKLFDSRDSVDESRPPTMVRPESPLKSGETMLSLTRGRPRPRLTSPTINDGRRSSLLFAQISPPAVPHPGDVGNYSGQVLRSSTSPTKCTPPHLHDLNNDRMSCGSKNKTIPSPTGSETFSPEVEFPVFFSFQQIVGSMMKSVTEGERLGPGRGVTLQDFFDAADAVANVMASSISAHPQRVSSAGACSTTTSRSCCRRGSSSRCAYLGVKPPISPDGQRRGSWVGGMRNRSSTEYNRSRCLSASSSIPDSPGDDDESQYFPLGRTRSFTASTVSPATSRNGNLSSKALLPRRRIPGGPMQRLTDSVTNGNMRLIVTDDSDSTEEVGDTCEASEVVVVADSEAYGKRPVGSGSPAKSESLSRPRKGSLIEGACRPRRNSRAACFIDVHPSPQTIASADVDFGNLIGSGSFGDVFKAKCKDTGEFIAVKVVSYEDGDKASEVAAKQLANEMDILQQLEHPNIIRYLGHEFIPPNVEWDPLPRDSAVHHRLLQHRCSMGRLLVFTEYMSGGSVKAALNDFGAFEEPQIASYSHQILSGLEYLHKRSVSHRDLKCDNLLLDAYGTVKLGDFGSSRQIGSSVVVTQLSGSIPWMAPEVISAGDSKGYSISADIWSFGIVIIEMATGTHPWGKLENPVMAIYKILSSKTVPFPEGASPQLSDFLSACLQYEPCGRATCSELLRHPFLTMTL
ncbi:mitogen activated protein kinase kinase kinase 3, mapkkk3, mekk3, putative [Perkinsus marinus ATCC 50983]|uniref:Mitogen activated protein kinase kinase kinase 3, mapkkk3, mekk3, putative n=1 Tax=Perkinsus marinus (strain ATCC 50983 / TXsc) TaxID=423536 RepID=C5LBW3_PERM5|nr:mitogen activated protein kinase kinase kinase 3, mapkkk3, mekk3, putative [Perkinsus marinus ATCC 50983]EER05934.1 mitogen activated protein kinase kinase kinase 3, mapkkk3, mekk3, putative [Perkinsus marinus ATCC 50983]|eukprot:XP_002774118.1 mitogen activated protein kinase kinase kinase 3, mapkkk3, mekk3, putative [Perkinsus marinus ATCC 50983]